MTNEFDNSSLTNDRYRRFFKELDSPIYVWQKRENDFILIDYNNAADRLSNGQMKEFLRIKASEYYKDQPNIIEDLILCYEKKEIQNREIRSQSRTMDKITFIRFSYVFIPPEFIFIHTDMITKQREVEFLLEETEEKFRTISDQSMMAICIVQDGIFKYLNQRMAEISGYSIEEIKSWRSGEFVKLISPEFREFIAEQGRKKKLGLKDVIPKYEIKGFKKSGKEVWIDNYSKKILYEGRPAMLAVFIDITERKKAEEKLKYQAELVENVSDAILSLDMDYNILSWNKAAERIYGWKSNEVIGRNLREIIPVEFLNKKEEEVVEEFLSNGYWNGEGIQHKKDGSLLNIFSSSTIIKDTFGRNKEMVKINKDITQQKRAQEKLVKEREKANIYLDLVAVIIVALDRDGNITLLNKKGYEILEWEEGDLINKNWFETCIPPNERERVSDYFQKLIAGKIEVVPFYENPIWTKNRKSRLVAWSTILIKDKEANNIGILSSGQDITDQKKAGQKLIESERKYRNLFDNSPYIIALIDKNAKIIELNSKIEDILRFKRSELIGRNFLGLEIFDKNLLPLIKDRISSFSKGIILPPFEVLVERKDGRKVWLLSQMNPVKMDNEYYALTVVSDITDKRKNEIKLLKSENKFRKAFNRAEFYKDLFTHDINNILQNIKSANDLFQTFKNKPEQMKTIEEINVIINEQVIRGANLVSNIQKLSLLEEFREKINSIKFNFLLESAILYVKRIFQEREIRINVYSFDKELCISANEFILDVFETILINAVKYNKNPIIEIEIIINKDEIDKNPYIKFQFLDNAMGIRDERKEIIFQRVQDKKLIGSGMGLGLSLVKNIIQSYHGRIWVENRIKGDHSKGSNFIILIPEVSCTS